MSTHTIEEIIVIGSGNWGLTLGVLLSKNRPTRIWTIDAAMARHLNANRKSPEPFYKYPVPDDVVIEEKYSSGFDEYKALFVMAVPSGQVRQAAEELGQHAKKPLVLSVSKGFDAQQQCTMSELIKKEIPGSSVVVMTGPTIANEVAEGKPTRAVLACDELAALATVKQALQNDTITFEVGPNPTHHEIFAALKGIVAIATGIADGLDLGSNAKGVIITEGLKELAAIASFFGIPPACAYQTSGAADLIATCISLESRNVRLGRFLAEGKSLKESLEKVGMTVEGVAMARTIETLWSLNESIPLIHTINLILSGKCADARKELTTLIRTF